MMQQQTQFTMINVGNKKPTQRTAIATGSILVSEEVFQHIKNKTLHKGDVLTLCEVAGITAAKRTYDLLPLCHPLGLDHVEIKTELDEKNHAVNVYCMASTFAKTGVEMEALCGANAALLCIYDLTKMYGHGISINAIKLLFKCGGKQGFWLHPDGVPTWVQQTIDELQKNKTDLNGLTAAVVTLSDRASQGVYEDESGKTILSTLEQCYASIIDYQVLADEAKELEHHIKGLLQLDEPPRIIITTGGTGLGPRDITPETLAKLCDKQIDGLADMIRQHGAKHTPFAWMSRIFVGSKDKTILIALPGSKKAVAEGLEAILPILPHALSTTCGLGHE